VPQNVPLEGKVISLSAGHAVRWRDAKSGNPRVTSTWSLRTPAGSCLCCPRCKKTTVRYTDTLRFLDFVMDLIGYDSVRCRNCYNRFFAHTN
jgi:hypothetical protein